MTQQSLAMYQLYLVALTLTLPETKAPETPVRSDSPECSVADYIKMRVTNESLFNILTDNGIFVDIEQCITPEFELAVVRFGDVVAFEIEKGTHTGKKLQFCTQSLVNYFNFFKNNGTAPQFAHAVVDVMTKKAKLSMSPAHTPNDIFSHYVTIVRASFS